jgi:small subunit ribosomal protein S4
MLTEKKNKYKPVFKQLIRLRENIQNRQKLLKFKKAKWKTFKNFYLKKLRRYNKFKPLDQAKYFVTKFGTKGVSYKKRFRDTLHAGKRFRLFYGNLLKQHLKKKLKLVLKKNLYRSRSLSELEIILLQLFESRLDTVLYRAKFTPTIRTAQQLILHGKVFVNRKLVKTKTYQLKNGDIVHLNLHCLELYENFILKAIKWSLPPKHLVINYRTLQILFLNINHLTNPSNEFSFNLRLQKILINYFRQ